MILTLCGSARFEPWFHAWNEALTLAGHCVFSLAAFPSQHAGDKDWYTPEQKLALDRAHFAKIAASDAIVVLNPYAYLGESTLREIKARAEAAYFLESWGKGCGIGRNHGIEARAAARAFGVPVGFGSPINTFDRSAWDPKLLGEGGAERGVLVEMIRVRTVAAEAAAVAGATP